MKRTTENSTTLRKMSRRHNWPLANVPVALSVAALVLGCSAENDPEPQDPGTIHQSIVTPWVLQSTWEDIYIRRADGGACTAGIIAQDALLTAAHCLPERFLTEAPFPGGPLDLQVMASRKLADGVFQCLFNPFLTGSTAASACGGQTVYARAFWHPDAEWRGDDNNSKADIAVLRFLWTDSRGRRINTQDLSWIFSGEMIGYGYGSVGGAPSVESRVTAISPAKNTSKASTWFRTAITAPTLFAMVTLAAISEPTVPSWASCPSCRRPGMTRTTTKTTPRSAETAGRGGLWLARSLTS